MQCQNQTKESQKELNAFAQKAIKDRIAKELSKISDKKHKSNDDEGLNAFDIHIDLSDFNYKDMDNLKINSSNKVSCWMAGQDKSLNSAEAEAESVDLTNSCNQADSFIDYSDLHASDDNITKSTDSSRNAWWWTLWQSRHMLKWQSRSM